MLKNGAVVRGDITQSADRWIISGEGRQMSIPASNVELAAPSLEALLAIRRAQVARPTAEAHLSLADWCLQHNLLIEAAAELAAARAFDPRQPRLLLLERRLKVANEIALRPAAPPADPSDDAVQQQSSTQPPNAPAADSPSPPMPWTSESVPPGAIEPFTRRIQPILLNNCTTAGCHQQNGPQSFQLDRAMLHDMANRQSTMHNLRATLALVDRAHPEASPLLTVPRAPHGGLDHPVFGPRQNSSVRQLFEWVALVANSPPIEPTAVTAADGNAPASTPPPTAVEPADLPTLASPQALPRFGVQLKPWQPRDPFDPEIFNRQIARDAAASERAQAQAQALVVPQRP